MPLVTPRFRVTRRRVVALVLALVVLAGVAALAGALRTGPGPVRTEEFQLSVPAGPGTSGTVSLDTTLYLPSRTPAPAVLVAHGFGGSKASVDADARDLANRGFVALAWSARGFGRSTGQIALNSPDYEVADASRLIDYLATRPEVRLDAPGDPRVGVTGGSYGGALALLLAGYDHRVDAIAPAITWNDLGQALFPNAASSTPPPEDSPARTAFGPDGVFKRGWAGIFFSAGLSNSRGRAGAPAQAGASPPADDTPASSDVQVPSSSSSSLSGASGGASGGNGGLSGSTPGSTSDPASGSADTPADSAALPPPGSAPGTAPPGTAPPGTAPPGTAPPGTAPPGTAPPGTGPDTAGTATSCGRFVPAVCQAYADAATTGRASAATIELLRRSSPASVAGRITAPTLLIQGETDTLFGLDQADATAREIAAGGGTVSVIWYSGGHDGGAPGPTVRARVGAWFDRYLREPSASGGSLAGAAASGANAPPPVGGLSYAVQGGVRGGRTTPTVRTVTADRYPGLPGAAPVQLDTLALRGEPQSIVNPPGGTPAALTTVPGVGGALGSLAGRLAAIGSALPGQSASFTTDPLPRQVLVAGSSRIRITVAPVPGQPTADEAVLFGGLTDIAPDGRRVLLGGAVAPMRIPLPAGGGPAEVTVTLPAVVAPVAAGHRLAVSLSTTDQAYQGASAPAVWRVGLAGGTGVALAVPVIPGRSVTANTVPTGPAVGIGLILAAALIAWLVGWLLRRRRARIASRVTAAAVPATATRDSPATATAAITEGPPPLVIEDLWKTYPGGITAVAGVSFTVRRNQVLGLLGPNGAGKTTVLRMLMGLIHPTGGEMRVFGHRVSPGAEVLSRVGSFVEGPGLLPHLSGATNLRLYWASTGRPEADARLEEALEIAGLGSALERAVRTYSQGMRQRLAIAQAMLGLPDVLVLDEPTNGLDPPQISAMRDVLRNYARNGRSVLLSSHMLAEVEQTCDHVVVMHRGAVVADGSVAELAAGGGQASFRVDDPALAARVLSDLAGVSAVQVDGDAVYADLNGTPRADVVGRLVRAGVAVEAAGPRRRLEDAFLRLVGEDATP